METKWTAAKMRVQQLRVQARSAEEMAQRTRSSAQVKPPLPLYSSSYVCSDMRDMVEICGCSMMFSFHNDYIGNGICPDMHAIVKIA